MKKKAVFEYEEFEHTDLLNKEDQALVVNAYTIAESAYAPYSSFRVGASILLNNGEVVLGSNQENIAYPSGLCAERVALFYAGANFSNESINTICVVATGDLLPFEKILSPCGACRQVMIESEMRQKEPIKVILVSQNKRTIVFNSTYDLLPFAFGKD